jgi:hypothetical protein
LPLVSLILAAICPPCHWHRWQICHLCRWHWWCTFTCEYLRKFSKKFMEKNLKQKSLWHCPLKQVPCINDILKDNFIESNKKPDHKRPPRWHRIRKKLTFMYFGRHQVNINFSHAAALQTPYNNIFARRFFKTK